MSERTVTPARVVIEIDRETFVLDFFEQHGGWTVEAAPRLLGGVGRIVAIGAGITPRQAQSECIQAVRALQSRRVHEGAAALPAIASYPSSAFLGRGAPSSPEVY